MTRPLGEVVANAEQFLAAIEKHGPGTIPIGVVTLRALCLAVIEYNEMLERGSPT